MVRVLIVDDSAFMRSALSSMVTLDPEIEVVGVARDGEEAVRKVAELNPDIVTMDIEMPRMDGLEALRQIMAFKPIPVLMVSSLTTEYAKPTLDALDIGAVDFIPKNLDSMPVNIVKIKEVLINKIKTIAKRGLVHYRKIRIPRKKEFTDSSNDGSKKGISVVTIGASTGGPRALQSIVSNLPEDFPVPILIAQHMPASFTGPFAERLDQASKIKVKEAENSEVVQKGIVYIAPGRGHMGISRKTMTETLITINNNDNYIYKPSVDNLMLSAVENYSGHVLGVVLTGLGNDGTRGMKEIKNRGGKTITESESSCVVYGMPKSVEEAGVSDKVVPVEQIASEIVKMF